tara:strand:- start:1216 stop:1590 length:375 start_codon:yes stop_codon:yes gene_type:complete
MNKEENRIQVESRLPMVFSGELCSASVTSFLPVIYTSWVKAKWKALSYSGVVIPLTEKEGTTGNYSWMILSITGRVYRVWNEYNNHMSMSCYKLKEDRTIMIKGIGIFPEEDFTEFNFQQGDLK